MARRGENIRKRADGRWEGRVKKSCAPHSKYKSVYGKTYTEVKDKMRKYANSAEESMNGTEKEIFDEYAQYWLSTVENRCKYSTFIKYQYLYEKHLKASLGEKKLYEISAESCLLCLLQEYNKSATHLSVSTMKGLKYVLNQIIAISGSPISVPLPEVITAENKYSKKEVPVFSISEQNRLILYLQRDIDIYKAGILLCLYSGLRLGEICALKNENINLFQKTLAVTQTVQRIKSKDSTKTMLFCSPPKSVSSIRIIPLCDTIFEILNQIDRRGIYFLNGNEPMEPRTYQYKFKDYLKQAGIKEKNFHATRHTFATNCIANGMDMKCLSEILGHSDVKTTMNRYVHPSMENKRTQLNKCISVYGQKYGQ